MFLQQSQLIIRDALPSDAPLLCSWWNDGNVMAHAGSPHGIGTIAKEVEQQICNQDVSKMRLMIEYASAPIGEMCFHWLEPAIAEIGIKICVPEKQNCGLGSILLSMLCQELFENAGCKKIVVSTMLENKRAQHVYEKLGFMKTAVRPDCWRDQTGQLSTAIEYSLLPNTRNC